MHFRILDDYRQTMNENALRFVDKLRSLKNKQVDVYPMIRMCTFSILFGELLRFVLHFAPVSSIGFRRTWEKF